MEHPLRRGRALGAWALAFLLLLVALAPSRAGEIVHGEGLLWRVESADGRSIHVFGTIHSTDPRVHQIPQPVLDAFDGAGIFTLEVILTKSLEANFAQRMFLPDGRTLDGIVGTKMFIDAALAAKRYGLEPAQLRRLKPWGAMTILSLPPSEVARLTAGQLPLDGWFQRQAFKRGKEVHGLESIDEQIAVFDGMSEELQVAILRTAIDQAPEIDRVFEELTQSYLARDTGKLYTLMERDKGDLSEAQYAEFQERTLFRRNRVMAERLGRELAAGDAFVAVGALHLPGEKGLLSLLEQAGYRLTRVY